MDFARTLKRIRTDRGLDQNELAKRLGVSQKTISSWETGRTEPSMGVLSQLCSILECPMEELTNSPKREIGDISFEDIIVKINDLSLNEVLLLKDKLEERANYLVRVEMMLKERESLLDKVREYEERIQELEKGINRA